MTVSFVLFRSSFRHPGAPNITHGTSDGLKTLCGRVINEDAQIEQDERDEEPDCRSCAKKWKRSR